MKLGLKTFTLIAIVWCLFTLTTLFTGLLSHPLQFVVLSAVTLLFLCGVLYFYVFSKIELLNSQISKLQQHTPAKLPELGKDEIGSISKKFNTLLEELHSLHEQFEDDLKKRTHDLQEKNIQLQQNVAEHLATERKLQGHRETFARLAHYDSLTALPNRVFFNEILNKAINHARRHQKICAILVIDLNITQTLQEYGHELGDLLLKEIATQFANVLRSDDILARLDDDEFIVLLNDINKPKFASAVAEKILQVCAKPIRTEDKEFVLKPNIGICIYPNDGNSLEELFKNSELALEDAKKTGGSSYHFYTHEMNIEAHEFIRLGNALRQAIQKNELALYYQPQLQLKKGTVSGVEALIRWVHPNFGTIDPAKLVQIAEETGNSIKLAEWAIREACQTNKYWQNEGYEHISVAVNLSPKQFQDPNISQLITAILKETKLSPQYLEIEINENIVMDDIEHALEILHAIKATGVQLSIDHFGTGYTSISYLKTFPISSIKIDQTFIKGIPHNPNDNAITNAFIALAHNLGFEIVASGVETAEQVQYLALQNCDMVQGYFLSHPLPAAKVISQLSKLRDEVLL